MMASAQNQTAPVYCLVCFSICSSVELFLREKVVEIKKALLLLGPLNIYFVQTVANARPGP